MTNDSPVSTKEDSDINSVSYIILVDTISDTLISYFFNGSLNVLAKHFIL